MYRYKAYNLIIDSEFELPQFHSTEEAGQVRFVRDDKIGSEATEANPVVIRIDKAESVLSVRGFADFRIRNGNEVSVASNEQTLAEGIRLYLMGVVMGALLYQRGYFVLHASSVSIGSHAVAFMGRVGAGKSSLAAALHSRGHRVLADDNTAISENGPGQIVTPAFPMLKISSEVASAVGLSDDRLQKLHPDEPKLGCPASEGFSFDPVPLRAIYVLSTEQNPAPIRQLTETQALFELIGASMPTRLRQPETPEHFKMCARMAMAVPVFDLQRSAALESLPSLARGVEEHVSEMTFSDQAVTVEPLNSTA